MARLLLNYGRMEAAVLLTVHRDCVKAELTRFGRTMVLGWFRDEPSALAGVAEFLLMSSAILPELRRLHRLVIQCDYRDDNARHPVRRFARGTAIKCGPLGRRVVLLPGARTKSWLCAV